jgi:galactitol PTS system EIIA component
MPINEATPNNPIIQSDLVLLNLSVHSNEELIKIMAQRLIDHGLVKDEFVEAIIKREKEYPTGLPVGNIAAAIPHTDASYVLKSAMVVSVLQEPVIFSNMADPEEKLSVQIVFMLAMKEPAFQVSWLKKLMGLLNNPERMQKIHSIQNEQTMADFLNKCL